MGVTREHTQQSLQQLSQSKNLNCEKNTIDVITGQYYIQYGDKEREFSPVKT